MECGDNLRLIGCHSRGVSITQAGPALSTGGPCSLHRRALPPSGSLLSPQAGPALSTGGPCLPPDPGLSPGSPCLPPDPCAPFSPRPPCLSPRPRTLASPQTPGTSVQVPGTQFSPGPRISSTVLPGTAWPPPPGTSTTAPSPRSRITQPVHKGPTSLITSRRGPAHICILITTAAYITTNHSLFSCQLRAWKNSEGIQSPIVLIK